MIDTNCPHCNRRLKVPDEAAGKRVRCPGCKNPFPVAAATAADKPARKDAQPPQSAVKTSKERPAKEPEVDPPAKSKPPGKKGKKKFAKKQAERPAWLIPAIGGATVLLGLCLVSGIVGIVLMLPGGGGGGGGPNGPGGGNPAKGVAPAREPQAGPDSWMAANAPESAQPDQWKVQEDPPAPRMGQLQPFIPMPAEQGLVVYGYALQPNVSQAAVLVPKAFEDGDGKSHYGVEWLRYDLTRAEPLGRLLLVEDRKAPGFLVAAYNAATTPLRVALSPSGRRVAVEDGRSDAASRFIEVWGDDGQKVGRLPLTFDADRKLSWIAFGGEDRLWAAVGPRLLLWDVKTGEQKAEIKDFVGSHPAVSPGGKYLAAALAGRVAVLNAADGTEAGALPFAEPLTRGGVAFDPAGKLLAVTLSGKKVHMIAAAYEVASGKRTVAVNVPTLSDDYSGGVEWIGDRQLALIYASTTSAIVVDLDLHAVVTKFVLTDGKFHQRGTPTPDARHWHMRKFHEFEMKKLEGKQPRAGDVTSPWCLGASALPKEYYDALDKARNGGVLWYPGAPCRLTVSGKFVELGGGDRAKVVEASANSSAKLGYHIDPNAPLTLELQVVLFVTDDLACQSRVLKDGKPVLGTEGHVNMAPPAAGQRADPLTTQGFTPRLLPPLVLRDADLRLLTLPQSFTPGVDGLLDTQIYISEPVRDPYGPAAGK